MPSCGAEPHLFSSLQSPGDRRERGKRKPRLGPMPASQPQRLHQSEPRDSQQARGVPGQRDGRSAASTAVTRRHKTPRFGFFASHLRDRVHLKKKKYHLESGLNQRDQANPRVFVGGSSVVPRSKTSTGGVHEQNREFPLCKNGCLGQNDQNDPKGLVFYTSRFLGRFKPFLLH